MKKVLGIIGSPRKNGNTHLLVNKILEGAADSGLLTESILLKDLEIKECDGCHACWKGKDCSKGDDMNNIYPKIIESDIIVFGTPVYWYGPTALMKVFIDRFVYFNSDDNRIKIRDKQAVVVIPFEEDNPRTADLLVAFFKKCFSYLQLKFVETVIAPGVTVKGEVANKKEYLDRAYACGIRLAYDPAP
jgi:multimeric flavodoxin WrbA